MKRIIKRYLNRKLYDTVQSTYVTLEDVAEMFRQGDNVKVLENNTNRDITYHTQLQMLFDLEKKYVGPENTELLRRIIVSPTGRVTGYVKSLEKALSIGHHEMEEKMPEVVVPKTKPLEDVQLLEATVAPILNNNINSAEIPLESNSSNL